MPLCMFLPALPLQKKNKQIRIKKGKLRHSPQKGRNMIPTQIYSETINEATIRWTEQV